MSKRWSNYAVSGTTITRNLKNCPKCGPGIFLASHGNRNACGKCGYTEFIANAELKPQKAAKQAPKKEAKKKEPTKDKPEGKPASKEKPK
ncbi:30S ribosomal protein S27ae [uncultured archaeon]|nr:30S ribosomal protein S27ae [uncultured archaeon]